MLQRSSHPRERRVAKPVAAAGPRHAFVALLYGSSTAEMVGLRTTFASARRHGSTAEQVVLTPQGLDGLPQGYRDLLESDGAQVLEVPEIPLPASMHNPLEAKNQWGGTLTKLQAYNLTQYERVVTLDTDTVFTGLAPPDSIFEACGDADVCMSFDGSTREPGECLPLYNGGVVGIRPSAKVFRSMLDALARETRRLTTADQAFLSCFINEHHEVNFRVLPPMWNTCWMEWQEWESAYLVHFCGVTDKPWACKLGHYCGIAPHHDVHEVWQRELFGADHCVAEREPEACSGDESCHWCGDYCMDRRLACSDQLFRPAPNQEDAVLAVMRLQ